jgi:hypothetical protein
MMNPMFHLGMIISGVPYSTPGMLHTDGPRQHAVRRERGRRQQRGARAGEGRSGYRPALGKRVAELATEVAGIVNVRTVGDSRTSQEGDRHESA